MHSAIDNLLKQYKCNSIDDYRLALKEIVQQIALLGLSRGDFFSEAAFYGGTALRIFYGLQRFSEDLDFSLISPCSNYDLTPYCEMIQDELMAYGFEMKVETKTKHTSTNIESAFIKGDTLVHLLKIDTIDPPVSGVAKNEKIKIKLEIDIDPPAGAETEMKYLLNPIPYSVRVYTLPSLFAGKVHAVLCRNWQSNRVKGRDLYDYIWYLSKKSQLDIGHLEKRMLQSGHLSSGMQLNREILLKMLAERFENIDYRQAKEDVRPFLKDVSALDIWSADFFINITKDNILIS